MAHGQQTAYYRANKKPMNNALPSSPTCVGIRLHFLRMTCVIQGSSKTAVVWIYCWLQVAMIGSGAWACAAMHIVAQNCAAYDEADEFVDDVRMWVFEEDYQVGLSILHLLVVASLCVEDAGLRRQQQQQHVTAHTAPAERLLNTAGCGLCKGLAG
jgi:methionine-rich copper-binding protein CopC